MNNRVNRALVAVLNNNLLQKY